MFHSYAYGALSTAASLRQNFAAEWVTRAPEGASHIVFGLYGRFCAHTASWTVSDCLRFQAVAKSFLQGTSNHFPGIIWCCSGRFGRHFVDYTLLGGGFPATRCSSHSPSTSLNCLLLQSRTMWFQRFRPGWSVLRIPQSRSGNVSID